MTETFWPEVLVQELRVLVRQSRFDFQKTSSMLRTWWLSSASDITAKDRGISIGDFDKKSVVIDAESCRTAFARDYSNAPYLSQNSNNKESKKEEKENSSRNNNGHSRSSAQARASASMAKLNSASAPVAGSGSCAGGGDIDDSYAATFNLDSVDSRVVELDNSATAASTVIATGSPSASTATPAKYVESDETYEQLMDRLELQERANFKRKEEVFAKVAKILLIGRSDEGDDEDGDMTAGRQLAKAMGVDEALSNRFQTPADQEVHRAYQQGIAERANKKLSREEYLKNMAENAELASQREALRRRFDADSVDAQGDEFQFSSEPATAAADAVINGIPDLAPVRTANAKVLERLQGTMSNTRPATTSRREASVSASLIQTAVAASSAAAPLDLSMGNFINSDAFDELLSTLEAEQEQYSPTGTRNTSSATADANEDEESDLAEVLRYLDEAALSAKASKIAEEAAVENKPKVMLKAGMGIANDPRAMDMVNATATLPVIVPSSTHGKMPLKAPMHSPTKPVQERSSSSTQQSVGFHTDDDDDEDDDDDNAWKNRRKKLKDQAVSRPAPTEGDMGDISVFRGNTGPSARIMPVRKDRAGNDIRVLTTTERASDRLPEKQVRIAPAEESKQTSQSSVQSPSPLSAGGDGTSGRSPQNSLTPSSVGDGDTWADVPSPMNSSYSPKNVEADAQEEEEYANPVAVPQKIEAGGMLSSAGARARKGSKGGKLLNVKKAAA